MERIAGGAWDDDVQGALDRAVKEYADDFGFDLDEEGAPLEQGDSDRVRDRGGDGDGARATASAGSGAQQGDQPTTGGAVSSRETAAV
jgi:F-type H+-transporting ATPase subunit alpha